MKKQISVRLLALTMLLILLPISAFASETHADKMLPDLSISVSRMTGGWSDSAEFFGSVYEGYYAQLDSTSQELYRALQTKFASPETAVTLTAPGSETVDDAWLEAHLSPAYEALVRDHPEMPWLESGGYSVRCSSGGSEFSLILEQVPNLDVLTFSNAIREARESVDAQISPSSGRYDKVKAIHDSLCELASYTDGGPLGQTAYSALVSPCQTTCAGYSAAFKLLCDAYGIPCIFVSGDAGGPHAWNLVQMDGAMWYAADVTWADQDTYICYDYFLSGSETLTPERDAAGNLTEENAAFSVNHQLQNTWGGTAALPCPAICESAYRITPYSKYTCTSKCPTQVYGALLRDIPAPDNIKLYELGDSSRTPIPGTWAWKDDTQSVGNVGTNEFTIIFTPSDPNQYNSVEKRAAIDVDPRPLTITGATVSSKAAGDADRTAAVTGVTFSGLAGTETLAPGIDYTAVGMYADTDTEGPKSVTVTVTLNDTETASHYTLSGETFETTGAVTVAPVSGHAVITPSSPSVSYGDSLSISVSGIRTTAGAAISGGTVELYSGTAKLASAPVSGGAALLRCPGDKKLSAGENRLTVKYTGAGYGEAEFGPVSVTLTPRPLTGAIDTGSSTAVKIYDGSAGFTGVAVVLSGVEAGDSVAATAHITAADANVGEAKAIAKAVVTLAGTDADYYAAPAAVSGTVAIIGKDVSKTGQDYTVTLPAGAGSFTQPAFSDDSGPVTGTLLYTYGGQACAYEELKAGLAGLAKGASGSIGYTFTANGNYTGSITGTIRFTVADVDSSSGSSSSGSSSAHSGLVSTGSDGQITLRPPAAVSGGRAVAELSPAAGSEIVHQAAKSGGSVIIAPSIPDSVTSAAVTIPSATVGDLGSKTSAGVVVDTPVARVSIPNGALSALSGDDLTVSASRTGGTLSVTIERGAQTVGSVDGGLTVTAPLSGAAPGAVAVLVNSDGSRSVIRRSVAVDGSIYIPLAGSARVEIVDNSRRFQDVPSTSWAWGAVSFAGSHELFSGTGADLFSPDAAMTRGMAAVVLHNLENNPASYQESGFSDVSRSDWYYAAVCWAAERGIVSGRAEDSFDAGSCVTREQLVLMLYRCAGSPRAASGLIARFDDASSVSGYARTAMDWAVEQGIISGTGGNRLDPAGYATRAQAAQMLKTYLECQR